MSRLYLICLALVSLVMIVELGYESRAISYLSDDPAACVNCHNMRAAYSSWGHGSHGRISTCNSCHVPHSSTLAKFLFKGRDGIRHAAIFTLNGGPQNLILNPESIAVVQENCIRCHSKYLDGTKLSENSHRTCWDCHSYVAHGKVRSISSSQSDIQLFHHRKDIGP